MFRRIALSLVAAVAGFTAVAANLSAPPPAEITGLARVIDGDTFDLSGTRIRLFGADAPERDQLCQTASGEDWACGSWATSQVAARLDGRRIACRPVDRDRYGRTVARCLAGGEDIAARLVADGVIAAYPRYSRDYVALEAQARAAGRGLWAGQMQRPEDYRHAARPVLAQQLAEGCTIKGNISNRGRIYHLPGSEAYAKTRIDEARGERWFCSVAAAEAAGWRAAGSSR